MSSKASEFFREQALILFEEYRNGKINANEYMKLLGMVYGDYLDNHPEEHPYFYDKQRIESQTRHGPGISDTVQ